MFFSLHFLFPRLNLLSPVLARSYPYSCYPLLPNLSFKLISPIISCPFILIPLLPFLPCFQFSSCAGAVSCSAILWLAEPSSTVLRTRFSLPALVLPSSLHLFTFPCPCCSPAGRDGVNSAKGDAYDGRGFSQGLRSRCTGSRWKFPSCSAAMTAPPASRHPRPALPSDGCTPAIAHFAAWAPPPNCCNGNT